MEVIWTGTIRSLLGGRFTEWSWGHELYRDLVDGTLYRRCRGKEQPHLQFDTLKLRKMNRSERAEFEEFESERARRV